MRMILAAPVCLALSSGAIAASPKANCADPQSNLEMKMCASENLTKADAELNQAFERALEAAKGQYESVRRDPGFESMPNMPDELRKVERAWMAFRDANCDYQNLVYYGGSMASLAVIGCRLDMTKARTKELKDLVESK
jgi:uncharacterized protein YecT (DUF1311 family)